MKQLIQPLLDWYATTLHNFGFPLVALLMTIESCAVPLPSEFIIPPAAHLGWTGGLPLFGAQLAGWPALIALVIAGALGSWAGASIVYWVARLAGRPLILRYGRFLLISPEKIAGAERWAAKFGTFGVFTSRLLPVMREVIGIPAGIVRLNYLKYSLFTLFGSALWCSVLCWLGVTVGAEIGKGEMHKVTFVLVGFVAAVGVLYYLFVHRHMKAKPAAAASKS
jgi:membrane protein DedA with SNARE-associated domain